MVMKIVWCLISLLFLNGIRCLPSERDLYVFKTVADADFDDEVQDAEPAETNTYANSPEDSSEDPPGPPDHVIPYSEHEDPGEVPTRPKYVAPGAWAKPDPKRNIPLDFVPTKTLAQVRGTHTVKVLPQSEALAAATSAEERENAPRLRQVVSKKKTNTIYTEEGYEDSAYDHAGHIRDADFHEGYARKLHDERRSEGRSGAARKKKLKKGKSRKKIPPPKQDQFEEFSDDYSDEHARENEKYEVEESKKNANRKKGKKIIKEAWNRPDINPKIVAENEIEKLEDDLRREAEEVEKGSENYSSVTEMELLRNDESQDSSSSSEKREKAKARLPSSKRQENFYREDYEATTIQFETPKPRESAQQYETSTLSYENPTTVKFYLPEGSDLKENYEMTTLNYGNSNEQELGNAEIPTTANYGDIFWKYFKTKSNEVTTPYSQEQSPSVALATINGHGPYLLLSENGGVEQNREQFGTEATTYYPTTENIVQNGHQYTDPFGVSNQDYFSANGQGANSRSGYEFPGFVNSGGPMTSPFDNWGLIDAGYSSLEVPLISTEPSTTRFYDNIAFSSTPGYSVIGFPPNEYRSSEENSRDDLSDGRKPLVNSVREAVKKLDSYERENVNVAQKGWPAVNENNSAMRTDKTNPSKSESEEAKAAVPFFRYTPNLEYTKILNYLKNERNEKYDGQKSESAEPEDFTIMKPPTPRESVFSDFTLSSYPNVDDYSSVKQESGAAQETNGKQFYPKKNLPKYNDLSQKGIHTKSPRFYADYPSTVINRKKLFPPSKLLPPAPYSKDNYAAYIPVKQSSAKYDSNFGNGVKNYNPDPKELARYLNNRKIPSRFRRSLDEAVFDEKKIADAVIAQEINARFNFTFEDQGSTQNRTVRESPIVIPRAKRNLVSEEDKFFKEYPLPANEEVSLNKNEKSTATDEIRVDRSSRGKRSHQDLLDASHKIAGEVVDKEIDSRFGNKHDEAVAENEEEEEEEEDGEEDNEEENEDEDEEAEREKQIEIEVPDFDYLDEIEDVNNIEDIPTTSAASVDLQKYPFYKNNKVDNASPLKYVINPNDVPRKTFGGMEFYESRDKYIQCDEVDPNLDEVIPDEEEPVPNRGPKENLPRLRGLGDKLDCFKAKYFGENPFDSPLFFEKKIDQPTAPSELDPMKFAARISALPEENRKYFVPAQTKKTETVTIKRMDDFRQHGEGKNVAETSKSQPSISARGRKRHNDDYNKSKESSTQKPRSQLRRIRKRRPAGKLSVNITEAATIKPATPLYEKEVYDDVMGTIKNLASIYEMIESQTVAPVTETTIVSPNSGRILGTASIRNGKPLSRMPLSSGNRDKNLYSLDATETPSHEEIEGLLPPPELNTKPKLSPYRINKVPFNTRMRTENPLRNGERKIIGYYRTLKVHKRSLDGNSDVRSNAKTAASRQAAKKWDVPDLKSDESQVNYRTVSPDGLSSSTSGQNRKRKRKINLGTTTTTTAASVSGETLTKTQDGRLKSVYRIKTRSKNSKDEKTRDKNEAFATTQRTTSAIDDRRKEPRYREIMRRRGRIDTSTTTTTTTTAKPQELKEVDGNKLMVNHELINSFADRVTEPREIYESEHSVPRRRKVSIVDSEPSSEIYKAIGSEFEPEHVEEDGEDLENYEEEEEEEEEESTDAPEKSKRKYDVHEDVQEETTPSTIGFPSPVKTSDHVDLETYLSTDPPGFHEAFADVPSTKASYVSAGKPGDDEDSYREEVSKEEQVDDDDEGGEYNLAPKKDSYREEESSEEEEAEVPKISESHKASLGENTDESADEKKNPELEDTDVGTFFKFNARPDSPFENFEDKKYSDLGPRINKPAFHHPHFEPPKYERYLFDDSKTKEEKDKTEESSENEKYEFPWAHDEEDEEAEARERYVDEATEKYEYPWEKRERLAEERKKRRKDRERLKKLRDFSFFDDTDGYGDDDDDEKKTSSSETNKKVVYPWQYYDDVPSKAKKKSSWRSGGFDSEEMSSNHRPVAKFSSKYSSSKFKLPFPGSEPITVAEPKKIRKSILNYLRDEDEKSAESIVGHGPDVLINPEGSDESDEAIKRPGTSGKELSTPESFSYGSKNKKRISNSRIIPENITPAPRNANRSKVTHVRDRTTLRPSVKSTVDATAVLKTQTAVTPITTTRRPWRLRGRIDAIGKQPSYVREEYRTGTSTALPAPLEATTEKALKSSNKNSDRVFVRKRGYLKNTVNVPGSNSPIQSSGQNSDAVTQRSLPATTTVRRRKLPTAVTTSEPITKVAFRDAEKGKIPSKNFRDSNMDNSTPTSRTVEHRSRVSQEEIITKTSFPDENAMYKIYKNKNMSKKSSPFSANENSESLTDRKSKITYSETPDRVKNTFSAITELPILPDEIPVGNESIENLFVTTEGTSEPVYQTTESIDSDYFRGMFDSFTPENHTDEQSAPKVELQLEKTATEELEKKTTDRGYEFDEIKTQSAESKEEEEEVRGASAEDSSASSKVASKSPPGSDEPKESEDDSGEEIVSSEENSSTEYDAGDKNEYEESDESEEGESSSEEKKSSVANYEKDPSRRKYYFLEDKKR